MKFDNLYIECENLEQRDEVFNVCLMNGLELYCSANKYQSVRVTGGVFFTINWKPDAKAVKMNYPQFAFKYGKSEMKQSIEKAMADLKMGREELSSALGMSRPYITKMLTCPQSEKTQAKVIKMIDDLIESVNVVRQLRDDVSSSPIIIDERDNQALEYKDQLLAKNEDELEKTHRENGKLEKIYLHRTSECGDLKLEISLNAGLIRDLNNGIERLSKENSTLKRENKDIQIHHAIVCVILIILVAWGFYV